MRSPSISLLNRFSCHHLLISRARLWECAVGLGAYLGEIIRMGSFFLNTMRALNFLISVRWSWNQTKAAVQEKGTRSSQSSAQRHVQIWRHEPDRSRGTTLSDSLCTENDSEIQKQSRGQTRFWRIVLYYSLSCNFAMIWQKCVGFAFVAHRSLELERGRWWQWVSSDLDSWPNLRRSTMWSRFKTLPSEFCNSTCSLLWLILIKVSLVCLWMNTLNIGACFFMPRSSGMLMTCM